MKTRRFLSWLGIILAVQFCFSCSSPAPEPDAPATVPLDGRGGGVIAYCYQPVSGSDPHTIYLINADGSGNKQLSHEAIGLNHYDWSPDGQKLAMAGYLTQTNWPIYVMNADGSDLTRLTHEDNTEDTEPVWSPDGTRIAFTRIFPAQNNRSELWLMDADGANPRWIGLEGIAAKWSADGSRFIYGSNISGNWELYSCRVDGSGMNRLTLTPTDEFSPEWSPDGSQIVFSSNRDSTNSEIYAMNADGTNWRRLTNTSVNNYGPRWSPDGSHIAFSSELSVSPLRVEVFIIHADGGNLLRVTNSPNNYISLNPAWKPGY